MSLVTVLEAVKILKSGGIVALPTETVYGLAGSIQSETALKSIFSTKGRPLFDPLIVHVASTAHAPSVCTGFGELHQAIAQKFWPGPVTLIGERAPGVSDLVTAGHSTVAVRCPNHPLFLQVLKQSDLAVAAPSANRFQRTSPTEAEHELSEFQGRVPVLDGGPSQVGVESTILEPLWEGGEVVLRVFRPGMIRAEQVAEYLRRVFNSSVKVVAAVGGPVQPGALEDHYQPALPLFLLLTEGLDESSLREKGYNHPSMLTLPQEVALAARLLYSSLRKAGQQPGADSIVLQRPSWWFHDDAEALRDRLLKASTSVL